MLVEASHPAISLHKGSTWHAQLGTLVALVALVALVLHEFSQDHTTISMGLATPAMKPSLQIAQGASVPHLALADSGRAQRVQFDPFRSRQRRS